MRALLEAVIIVSSVMLVSSVVTLFLIHVIGGYDEDDYVLLWSVVAMGVTMLVAGIADTVERRKQ